MFITLWVTSAIDKVMSCDKTVIMSLSVKYLCRWIVWIVDGCAYIFNRHRAPNGLIPRRNPYRELLALLSLLRIIRIQDSSLRFRDPTQLSSGLSSSLLGSSELVPYHPINWSLLITKVLEKWNSNRSCAGDKNGIKLARLVDFVVALADAMRTQARNLIIPSKFIRRWALVEVFSMVD